MEFVFICNYFIVGKLQSKVGENTSSLCIIDLHVEFWNILRKITSWLQAYQIVSEEVNKHGDDISELVNLAGAR